MLTNGKRTTTIVTETLGVVIGADTHLYTIHLVVITDIGKLLRDAEFATTPAGYVEALGAGAGFGRRCSPGWKAPPATAPD